MQNISTLREMFPTSILIASQNGFSVMWPNGFCGCESTERQIGEDRFGIFQELVSSSTEVIFDCTAGKCAKISFMINGFSSKDMVFLPLERDVTIDDLQKILDESGVCDEWVEVFGDVNPNDYDEVKEAFAEFFKRVEERESLPADFQSFTNWNDLLTAARAFHKSAAFFDLETYPPTMHGGGGCVVFDSSQSELDRFSHVIRDRTLSGFLDVINSARDADVLLCCCDDGAGVGFSFMA